jgi:hypothetical protein
MAWLLVKEPFPDVERGWNVDVVAWSTGPSFHGVCEVENLSHNGNSRELGHCLKAVARTGRASHNDVKLKVFII